MDDQWEYKILVCTMNGTVIQEDNKDVRNKTLDLLNYLGDRCWEVATEVVFFDLNKNQLSKYTLKRRK